MYNRYVPQGDGTYRKNRVAEPKQNPPPREKPQPPPCFIPEQKPEFSDPPPTQGQNHLKTKGMDGFLKNLLPGDFDTGDLLVIILLLLMAGDSQEGRSNAMLTIAMYFLM